MAIRHMRAPGTVPFDDELSLFPTVLVRLGSSIGHVSATTTLS